MAGDYVPQKIYTSLTSIDCIFINEDDISGPLKIKRTNCDSFLNWTNE
jgi:hypothetical protein